MNSFFEPLILFWVLFLRVSFGTAAPGEPVTFSVTAEIARIVLYSVPSLLLVWHIMLKEKGPGEWGIALPRKSDIVPAALAFPALILIGMTISFITPHIDGIPSSPRLLPPQNAVAWTVLVISCFCAAYLEESYFRFYLLSKREDMGIGPNRAILFSTLLFSVCHVYEGPWGFLNAALSGVVLAYIFLRFRSLHGISIAHALYNILVYILASLPSVSQ